jgi:hypothetical protein
VKAEFAAVVGKFLALEPIDRLRFRWIAEQQLPF